MPAVQAPALWLTVAATTVSAVAVTAMALSDGMHRPLTFAGAILLPDSHSSASQPAAQSSPTPRPSASPTGPRPSATPSASVIGYPSPVAAAIPVQRDFSGVRTSTAPQSSPAAAGGPVARPTRTSPVGEPAAPGTGPSAAAVAQALFTALNTVRTQAGLAPLSWSVNLQRSAAGHNQQMAAADQLASRVADEPSLGVRQANQGIAASYAAESSDCAESAGLGAAMDLQQLMLAEQPPDDSRRQNLLSSAVNTVGIDVLLDPAHNRLWLTEDFAQLP